MTAEEILRQYLDREYLEHIWKISPKNFHNIYAAMEEYASQETEHLLSSECYVPVQGVTKYKLVEIKSLDGMPVDVIVCSLRKSALQKENDKVAGDGNKREFLKHLGYHQTLSPVKDDWISVEEKGYPEHNVGVLVFIPDEDFHITSGMWDVSNKWVLLDEYRVPECEVTHWMPLVDIPNEYRKERDKGNEVMRFLKKYLPKK